MHINNKKGFSFFLLYIVKLKAQATSYGPSITLTMSQHRNTSSQAPAPVEGMPGPAGHSGQSSIPGLGKDGSEAVGKMDPALSECSTEFASRCFRLLSRSTGGPKVQLFMKKPWFVRRAAPGRAEINLSCFPKLLLPPLSLLPPGLQLMLNEPQRYSTNHFCL